MKSKKILLVLFIALAVTVLIFFAQKAKAQKPRTVDSLPAPTPLPPTNGGAATTPVVVQTTPQPVGTFPLTMGSRGKAVQIIQIIVGVTPDGVWGQNTQNAVMSKLKTGSIDLMKFLIYTTQAAANDQAQFPLRSGSRGNYVKGLQVIYGLKIDGVFGPNTLAAVLKDLGTTSVSTAQFSELFKRIFT